MDIILIVVGVVMFLIGSAVESSEAKKSFKIFGAILILIGGIWFAVGFMTSFNNAVQMRTR